MATEVDHDGIERFRDDAPPGLFLSRRGAWYHDGQRVGHAGLEGLLHRSIARAADGTLIVTTGRDVLAFTAEDAPIVVRTIERAPEDLRLVLACGAAEEVACRTFLIDDDGRVRTRVRGGSFWGVLSRTATQLLLEHLDDAGCLLTPRGAAPIEPLTRAQDWTLSPAIAVSAP